MNRKAVLKANVIYIILTLAFIVLMSAFIYDQSSGSAVWAEYYSKEISRIANTATPGQEVTLDVHKATEIAFDKGITNFNEIFEFNNKENEICVKLSPNRKTCYYYFANVDITDYKIVQGQPINLLKFTVQEKPILEEQNE